MNKKLTFLKSKYIIYIIVLLGGVFMGKLFFGGSEHNHEHHEHAHEQEETEMWTCSMHPQIRSDKPGKCPLCGMDLTPLKTSSQEGGDHPDAIQLSAEAIALADIETITVSLKKSSKQVLLYGTVKTDERQIQSQTSHVAGRIEKLMVNFVGETIRAGQPIASIYSPELFNAQQELIEALSLMPYQPDLVQAAREKLRLWKLSERQIAQIEQTREASPYIDIEATTSGVVMEKRVSKGDYISQGSVMFEVANLSKVWLVFDAYEVDLPFLKVGSKFTYTLQALPGKVFSGTISFINPMLNGQTRTAQVRAEISNPNLELKPEMYVNATVEAVANHGKEQIVLPRSAVLWTGKRSIVYVRLSDYEKPTFQLREVELGASLGNAYIITSGVEVGDEVVVNGAFTIDAAAQLEGKESMMNRDEEMLHEDSPSHEHSTILEASINVNGNCGMCQTNIETAAKSVKGVLKAHWDADKKILQISYSAGKVSVDDVEKAVAAVGYDTQKYRADDQVYNSLPACCHYR